MALLDVHGKNLIHTLSTNYYIAIPYLVHILFIMLLKKYLLFDVFTN